jgi:hypothetical protein
MASHTCAASSRVGTSTSTRGRRGLGRAVPSMRCSAAKAYAPVLPDPVAAVASTSRPASAGGMPVHRHVGGKLVDVDLADLPCRQSPRSLVSAPSTSPGRIFSLRPPRICSVTIGGAAGRCRWAVSSLSGCHSREAALRLLDAAHAAHLVQAGQAEGPARLVHAAGAADAVRVHLGVGRDVDVDHRLQLRDVQPARGDVGGHQHLQLRLANCTSTWSRSRCSRSPCSSSATKPWPCSTCHQVAALLLGVAEGQRADRPEVVQQQAHRMQALVSATS